MITLTEEYTLDKKENLKKLRSFHKNTLNDIGVSEVLLIGKMAYLPTGKSEVFVTFFYSEISRGHDIYLEFTNRDNVPEDIERKLYLWKFNPHYASEYEVIDGADPSKTRYYIPVSELKIIKSYTQGVTEKKDEKENTIEIIKEDYNLPDPAIDPPINEMTIRDLAAILLKKPVSNKQWLNTLISNI
jgi:hypothetical protein